MQRDNLSDQNISNDEINFLDLFGTLWLNKKFILMLTGIFAIFSVIFSLLLSNTYTSDTLLAPSSQNGNMPGQMNGLASVAGINLSRSNPDVTIAIAFIRSKKMVRQLIKRETFLPDLIAAKTWDVASNSIIYNKNIYDSKGKKWVREVELPFQQVPSEQEAFKKFKNRIKISQDRNDLLSISVKHISPYVAQQWAEWIVDEANMMVANLRIEEAQNSIIYLNEQVMLTPYSELRTMFFDLIQQNTQNMMLAKVSKQYALTVIDPPLIPEMKSGPNRAFICIAITIMGGMLSILIIFIRKYIFSKDDELDIFRTLSRLLSNIGLKK